MKFVSTKHVTTSKSVEDNTWIMNPYFIKYTIYKKS